MTAISTKSGNTAEGMCLTGKEWSGHRGALSSLAPTAQTASESGHAVTCRAFPCPVQMRFEALKVMGEGKQSVIRPVVRKIQEDTQENKREGVISRDAAGRDTGESHFICR